MLLILYNGLSRGEWPSLIVRVLACTVKIRIKFIVAYNPQQSP